MPDGALRGHELLQRAARGVRLDALRAVFAADAAPEGFVAVERDHFIRRAAERVHLARDGRGQRGEEFRRVGDVPEFVGVRVMLRRHGV